MNLGNARTPAALLAIFLIGVLAAGPAFAGGCDADGDGHDSLGCGGDDCDDTDPNRYPGNIEVCDFENHDEDCDSNTFGVVDVDGDSYLDASCCNHVVGNVFNCGTDCDDSRPGVHPNVPEVCNDRDDNCDGAFDEGLLAIGFVDLDGDGWGVGSGQAGCPDDIMANGEATKAGDCEDSEGRVNPGALELCNGIDDDCNGLIDEGFSGSCS